MQPPVFPFTKHRHMILKPLQVCNRIPFNTKKPGTCVPGKHVRDHCTITSILNLDDDLLVIGTAFLTDSVGHHKRAAFAAFHKSRSRHFPICSSLIPVTSGRSILRADRHLYHLLLSIFSRGIHISGNTRRLLYENRQAMSRSFLRSREANPERGCAACRPRCERYLPSGRGCLPYCAETRAAVSLAIASSSLVGKTKTLTFEPGVEISAISP